MYGPSTRIQDSYELKLHQSHVQSRRWESVLRRMMSKKLEQLPFNTYVTTPSSESLSPLSPSTTPNSTPHPQIHLPRTLPKSALQAIPHHQHPPLIKTLPQPSHSLIQRRRKTKPHICVQPLPLLQPQLIPQEFMHILEPLCGLDFIRIFRQRGGGDEGFEAKGYWKVG